MFFESANKVIPCGMFSVGHLILFVITMLGVEIALRCTKNAQPDTIKEIIKKSTVILWILEIIKIIFNIKNYGYKEVNKYVPLYFCSLILYAGIFSGFCKETLKKVGDTFLSTGGIVAGMIFLIFPLTSLTTYPALHFISLHSFLLHGTMVYIGLLMLKTKYVKLERSDIKYPGTFIEIIYNISGNLFSLVMITAQAILPFYFVYEIYTNILDKNENN